MDKSKQVWVWIGVAVVVIAAAAIVLWGRAPQKPSTPAPAFAPTGQLTPNFPKELILDPNAQVESSYAISYDAKTNQYTAQWNSSSSLLSLYNDYKTYLNGHRFTVTSASGASATSTLAVVYAMSLAANVNVTITAQGSGSQVVISYVAH